MSVIPGFPPAVTPGLYNSYPVPISTLLTPQSFEGATSGGWVGQLNGTVAITTAQAFDGTHSLAITSIAAGAVNVIATGLFGGIAIPFPIQPGAFYYLSAYFRAATTPQQCAVTYQWYDANQGGLAATPGSPITDSASAWTRATNNAIAPSNARFVILFVQITNTSAANEVHYVDLITLAS